MALPSTSTFTALDAVREAGITIASEGAEYNKIGEFHPIDATTNPSLVYAAVSSPQYFFLVEEAVAYAYERIPSGSVQEKTDLALDHLLVQVGAKILSIIPGRVSVSVDPRLGFSYEAILRKSRSLIALAEELHIPRSRVLIKIPATSAGIRAAQILESQDEVRTNMTLIFSLVQAIACAQAGATVISPFIGRVKDWWAARAEAEGNPGALANQPLSEHPGIKLVHRIREAFRRFGYDTQIMAAGFRKPEEIVEVSRAGRKGGVDLVTLPPDLLDGLRKLQGEHFGNSFQPSSDVTASLPSSAPTYFTRDGPTEEGLAAFDRDSKAEAISLDKVPEGLEKFSADTTKLENLVKNLVEGENKVRSLKSAASSAQQNAMTEGRRTVHVL
ncbi:aldolase [Agrocybe pediades]|nr:aldolase [Agrocybe pediades]